MKGTTNAQRNAIIDSTSAVDSLTLTKADGTTQKHTVSNIIPKDDAPTSGSSKFVTSGAIYTALQGRVPVESGKGLSTNDYTTAEKSKVSNLPDNANNTFATKTELTNAVSSVYKYKGTKATYSALPTSGNTTGDVWNVTAANGNIPAGTNYAWNGSAWDALGGEIDLSGYVPTSRTVNGKALTGNITLAASDVSAVPTTRKVNNKALSADITLTAGDVGALATNGTAAKATADASGNNIVNTYATKTELTNGLAGKQNSLTFDSAPTSGSSNPVTSGGVYSAINTVNTSISSLQSLVANKQDKLTFDTTPTSGSSNPITSGGVYTAINNKMDKKTIDTTVTSGSSNLITSGAVYTAISNISPGYTFKMSIKHPSGYITLPASSYSQGIRAGYDSVDHTLNDESSINTVLTSKNGNEINSFVTGCKSVNGSFGIPNSQYGCYLSWDDSGAPTSSYISYPLIKNGIIEVSTNYGGSFKMTAKIQVVSKSSNGKTYYYTAKDVFIIIHPNGDGTYRLEGQGNGDDAYPGIIFGNSPGSQVQFKIAIKVTGINLL